MNFCDSAAQDLSAASTSPFARFVRYAASAASGEVSARFGTDFPAVNVIGSAYLLRIYVWLVSTMICLASEAPSFCAREDDAKTIPSKKINAVAALFLNIIFRFSFFDASMTKL